MSCGCGACWRCVDELFRLAEEAVDGMLANDYAERAIELAEILESQTISELEYQYEMTRDEHEENGVRRDDF